MKTEQEYLQEAGVLYRRDTTGFPIEQGETLLWNGSLPVDWSYST